MDRFGLSAEQKPDAEKQQGAKNKVKDKGARLVSAYTLVPAVMDTAMDSDDQNSIAIAHVPTGAQAGAKFYSGQTVLPAMVFEFTSPAWS